MLRHNPARYRLVQWCDGVAQDLIARRFARQAGRPARIVALQLSFRDHGLQFAVRRIPDDASRTVRGGADVGAAIAGRSPCR